MKILSVNGIKNGLKVAALAAGTFVLPSVALKAQGRFLDRDIFQHEETVKPSGASSNFILNTAPSPEITIAGKKHKATVVVDLATNVLYHYDDKGNAVNAFLVASGKKSTPTEKGIRAVTHVETFPYKSAPASSKRRKKPYDYGPRIICLETVDPKTGARGVTGEFIHGNNNRASLGKYASKGCIRMDNDVIKALAKVIKRGNFVLIK